MDWPKILGKSFAQQLCLSLLLLQSLRPAASMARPGALVLLPALAACLTDVWEQPYAQLAAQADRDNDGGIALHEFNAVLASLGISGGPRGGGRQREWR